MIIIQGVDYNRVGKFEEARKLGEAALICDIIVIVFTAVWTVISILTFVILMVNFATRLQ